MLTTIMKYVAIATLLAGLFWRFVPNARTYLDFLVAAGAVFVLVQAIRLHKYWWVAGFSAVILLFNPIRHLEFSFGTTVVLQILTAAVFAVSLQLLKTSPRLTIASITEANPRTESL
jgi:Family of unknown function (DUF6804)